MKTILTTVVCTLVLAAFPATADEPRIDGLTVTNAPEGFTFPNDHAQRCDDQLALIATDYPGCEFEDEVVQGFGYMIFGFRSIHAGNTGSIPLNGELTAHVTGEFGGDQKFTCSWNDGVFSGCTICSCDPWLSPGEGYSFDCYSELGARGHWGECYIDHF